jgi:hypothetical protein
MKKISLLFVAISFSIAFVFAQKADNRIHTLIMNQDFFTLQKEYPHLKKSASEPWQLYAKFYLNSYFNKPEKANGTVELLSEYVFPIISGEERLSAAHLIADNEAKKGNYTDAASVYEQLLEQLTPQWDSNSLKPYQDMYKFYNVLQNVPPMEIAYTHERTIIPLKQDTAGLFTMPVHSSGLEPVKLDFVIDFGANFCMIDERYVDDFGIKIIADSILLQGGIGVSVYTKIGIADEIQIGEITLKNVLFFISSRKIVETDTISYLSNYEIQGVIGFPILQAFEHLTIEKTRLLISKSPTKSKHTPNMMIFAYRIYIKAVTPQRVLCLLFDSGASDSELNSNYLSKIPKGNQNLPVDSIQKGAYGGVQTFTYYKKKNFQCKIGDKKIHFPEINIYNDLALTFLLTDGSIGKDVILKHKQTIIDFKNMYFEVK